MFEVCSHRCLLLQFATTSRVAITFYGVCRTGGMLRQMWPPLVVGDDTMLSKWFTILFMNRGSIIAITITFLFAAMFYMTSCPHLSGDHLRYGFLCLY